MTLLKKCLTAFLGVVFLIGIAIYADAAIKVKGYYRKYGTYVQPHYRSNPDGNPYNNWNYPGNVNPYTGEVAGGNSDTYLKNYYGGSGSNSTYSLPSSSFTQTQPVLARIIHEEAGRHSSTLLRSEAVKTLGPLAEERVDDTV
jgi:hypothetical protein